MKWLDLGPVNCSWVLLESESGGSDCEQIPRRHAHWLNWDFNQWISKIKGGRGVFSYVSVLNIHKGYTCEVKLSPLRGPVIEMDGLWSETPYLVWIS